MDTLIPLPNSGTDDEFSSTAGESSTHNFPSHPSVWGLPPDNRPLDRSGAHELATVTGCPTPEEVELRIPDEGMTAHELYEVLKGDGKLDSILGPKLQSFEQGLSPDLLRIISSVATLDEGKLKKKRASAHPSNLPDGTFPMMNPREHFEDLRVNIKLRDEDLSICCSWTESVAGFAEKAAEFFSLELEGLKLWPVSGRMDSKPLKNEKPMREFIRNDAVVKILARKIEEAKRDEEEIKQMKHLESRHRAGNGNTLRNARPAKTRDWKHIQEESKYTFHDIKPLPYLPKPEKSKRFLERLANDPGIKASMRKHKFSVGLLTEMNPAEHTTHESRTLGLNRNRGEVIELRLRTDRYDGYRDYKVIRKTLCHELSHNVWGEHDRNFWDLTKQIEEEVERGDWKHGGHVVSNDEFYNLNDDATGEDHVDAGGWTGGEFVLGSLEGDKSNEGLTRREILARAATSRMEKQRKAAGDGEKK